MNLKKEVEIDHNNKSKETRVANSKIIDYVYSGPSIIQTHWAWPWLCLDNRKSNLLEYLLLWICQLQTPLTMMQASHLLKRECKYTVCLQCTTLFVYALPF